LDVIFFSSIDFLKTNRTTDFQLLSETAHIQSRWLKRQVNSRSPRPSGQQEVRPHSAPSAQPEGDVRRSMTAGRGLKYCCLCCGRLLDGCQCVWLLSVSGVAVMLCFVVVLSFFCLALYVFQTNLHLKS
jgi:hypothetical protein